MGNNAIDNTNLLEMNAGIGTIGFIPVVTYAYDAGAKTVTVTNSSTLQAGDSIKEIKIRVHDFFGKEVRGYLFPSAGGNGYQSPPTVVFPGPGVNAAATAVLTNGKVSSVVINTPGTGYTDGEVVTFTGGGGFGAVGTLLETGGAVDSVSLTNNATVAVLSTATLDASKQFALSVTIITANGLVADGGAYGLMAAGSVGHWDKQKNAQS